MFCYQHNLHSSQTIELLTSVLFKFCYQHNLHSSQTKIDNHKPSAEFCYQHNLHSSQTGNHLLKCFSCFATSIIYIVLKLNITQLFSSRCFATSIIYIVLKHSRLTLYSDGKFCYQHNLHSSQTLV